MPPPIKTQEQPTGVQFQLPSAHGVQLKSVGSPAPPSRAPPSPLLHSNNNGAPSPLKSSPIASPTSSPGVPRRLPPQPNIVPPPINHMPPPPAINHMPPPPQSSINKISPNSSPAPVKRSPMPNPNNINQMPPPPPPISSPSYKSPALNGVNNMPPPPPPSFVNNSTASASSSSSTCNTSNINSLNLSGGFPPPPMVGVGSSPNLSSQPFLKPPAPIMPRSSSLDPKSMSQFLPNPALKRHSVENKRLSQDLNSMLVNRLQHGLSPPVSTPFYDQNILGSTSKAQELKEKRDTEEKDRRDRERVKKEKEDQDKKDKKEKKEKEEQDKKDKKKKEEQEKLEKKEKKKKEEAEKKEKKSLKSSNGMGGSGGIACTTIFNNTLPQIMELQREKFPEYSNLSFPAILKILADGILALDGPNTEGIFRITGTTSEVNRLKKQINEHDFSIDSTSDPHVLAGLLKLFLRELVEPVIPSELYYQCIKSRTKEDVSRIIATIPDVNKDLINYLMVFLKHVSNPAFAVKSKMDIDNIAMVFAPGLLRCPVVDPNMLLNTQYEKDFIKYLIELS